MNSSTIRLCTIGLVVILVGALLYVCVRGWRNYRTFQKTESTVRAGLNDALATHKIDPIAVVVLHDASRLFGVPEHIRIEQSLFRTDAVTGRRPAGQLRGIYHRKTGQTVVDMDFVDGKRERGKSLMLDPVP